MRSVEVLGPVRVEGASITSPTQLLLLTVLAAAAPRAVAFSRLIDAVWDDPPPSAENSLHSHLTRLRKALGAGSIVREGLSYRLAAPTDAARFEGLLEITDLTPAERRAALDRALRMWRGHPFGANADHRFVRGTADALIARHCAAQREIAELDLAAGDAGAAVMTLRRLVDAHPLDEPAWALLVESLVATGRRAEAARAAHEARRRIAEVGLEPSRALVEAESLALQPGAAGHGRTMPRPQGPLIGRDAVCVEVTTSATDPGWTTLVGPGGVGKTRVALEAAERAPLPVSFVDLTEAAGEEVPVSIARAVGAALRPPYLDRAISVLASQPVWLVLDCCELVAEDLAVHGQRLLRECADLRVLATSRRPIGVAGERLIDLHPLEDAHAASLLRLRAGELGVDPPGLDLAQRLCRSVDCLPLNVEMLAGALRTLSSDALLEAVTDPLAVLHLSGGSLAASVDRSISLLSAGERSALGQLAMFRGPFVTSVARACAGEKSDQRYVEKLRRLRELSLLTPVDTSTGRRLRMLDTVRAVARAQAAGGGDAAAIEHRYACGMSERAREIAAGLRTADEGRWLEILESELGDLRAAHQLAIERGWIDVAMRIPAALFTLVYDRLRADLAIWADESLDAFGTNHPSADEVLAVSALGAMHVDDHVRAWSRLEQVTAPGRASAPPALVAANLQLRSGDLEATDRSGAFVVDAATRSGDLYLATIGHVLRGLSACYVGDRPEARHQVELTRRLSRKVGAPTLLAYADYLDGEVCSEQEPEVALALLQRAHDRAAECRTALAQGVALVTITTIRARSDQPAEATATFGAAIRHWRDRGDWNLQWSTLRNLVEFLTRMGAVSHAAVLVGAIAAHGPEAYGAEARRFAQATRQIEKALAPAEAARSRAVGRSLTQGELLEFALDALRVIHDDSGPSQPL